MGAVRTILGKDLRLRVRDRTLFIYGFVAPFLLAGVLGVVFGGLDDPLSLTVAVSAPADARLSDPLIDGVLPALEEDGLVEATIVVDGRDEAVDLVSDGDATVGFVVLPDTAAGPGGIEVLERTDAQISASVASAIARGLVDDASDAAAAVQVALASGAGVSPDEVVAALQGTPPAATVTFEAAGAAPLDARTRVAVGIAVFFLLFAVSLASTGLLEEEQNGTLARLRVAPIEAWTVLAAKALLGFLVGVGSLGTLAVATTLALSADWGAPWLVASLIVAGSAAAVGIVAAVASFARTPEAAGNATAVVATVAGALGGSFFEVGEGPVLSAVASATPHRWFLAGIQETAGGGSTGAVLTSVAVLLLMALFTGVLAAVRLRRRLAGP